MPAATCTTSPAPTGRGGSSPTSTPMPARCVCLLYPRAGNRTRRIVRRDRQLGDPAAFLEPVLLCHDTLPARRMEVSATALDANAPHSAQSACLVLALSRHGGDCPLLAHRSAIQIQPTGRRVVICHRVESPPPARPTAANFAPHSNTRARHAGVNRRAA